MPQLRTTKYGRTPRLRAHAGAARGPASFDPEAAASDQIRRRYSFRQRGDPHRHEIGRRSAASIPRWSEAMTEIRTIPVAPAAFAARFGSRDASRASAPKLHDRISGQARPADARACRGALGSAGGSRLFPQAESQAPPTARARYAGRRLIEAVRVRAEPRKCLDRAVQPSRRGVESRRCDPREPKGGARDDRGDRRYERHPSTLDRANARTR